MKSKTNTIGLLISFFKMIDTDQYEFNSDNEGEFFNG